MENNDQLTKQRGINFSRGELNKLRELLEKHSIILNKKTDHASSKQKDEAWSKLTIDFNADNQIYRSKKQLIYKFNNLKKTARKELSQEKRERRCTGGGPPPNKPSDTSEWLCNVMGESIIGHPSIYDSDSTPDINKKEDILQSTENLVEASIEPLDVLDDQTHDAIDCNAGSAHDTQGTEMQNYSYFDASTPKSMLKTPVSKPLVSNIRKRRLACTTLDTRKKIMTMASEKENYFKIKAIREQKLLELAEEEHKKNLQHKDELHQQSLKKCELEILIYKEQLKKRLFENQKNV